MRVDLDYVADLEAQITRLAAALNAWPNATKDELEPGDEPFLILPLPKEGADD
jgi:hypothetical protein